MSDSLRPRGLQHARLPCPSPTPRAHSSSCPLSGRYHPAISSSVVPFSSRLQSASGSFPASQFSASGGQRIDQQKLCNSGESYSVKTVEFGIESPRTAVTSSKGLSIRARRLTREAEEQRGVSQTQFSWQSGSLGVRMKPHDVSQPLLGIRSPRRAFSKCRGYGVAAGPRESNLKASLEHRERATALRLSLGGS